MSSWQVERAKPGKREWYLRPSRFVSITGDKGRSSHQIPEARYLLNQSLIVSKGL